MLKLLAKIKKIYKERRIFSVFMVIIRQFLHEFTYIKYIMPIFDHEQISLHCPNYVEPAKDTKELEIVARIFKAYKKMKEDQRNVPSCYLPSSLWQDHLDKDYEYLTSGVKTNDINKFHFFLTNFGAWKTYTGIEATTFFRNHMLSPLKRNYLKKAVFLDQLKIWRWFYNNRKPLSSLTLPSYGNQLGAFIDKTFVGSGSFSNEIHGSILSNILEGIDRPVMADLGGGYGKLGYFTLRNKKSFTFIDFDLPETLCLAAYYLMKVWPEKKVLLYGETEYSSKIHNQYDLIFMPSFEMSKLEESSIDLFVNKNSLGEMTNEAATNYINLIAKATNFFFHMNHDIRPNIYSDNNPGLLGCEYPVPMDKFRLLFRYPDMGHLLFAGSLDLNMDIFLYLYERKTDK